MLPASRSTTENKDLDQTSHYLLFETFAQNARKAEILRVSWSNGEYALEGTFSHDEVFLGNRNCTSKEGDLAHDMRAVIDAGEQRGVHVSQVQGGGEPHAIAIRVQSDGSNLRLDVKNGISPAAFIDRIMTYLIHVEARLHSEHERVQTKLEKHRLLRKEVDDLSGKKMSEDRRTEAGMRLLMTEKWQYWAGRRRFTLQ